MLVLCRLEADAVVKSTDEELVPVLEECVTVSAP